MLRVLLPIGAVLLSSVASADESGTARCAAMTDAQARLACYDALARPVPVAPPTEPETAPPAGGAERFGAENLPSRRSSDDVDAIESRLVGRFEGWKKGTQFELENGQVWRCLDEHEVYWTRDSPKVTIQRNFMGSYWLRVEGLNPQARVRRIR